MRQSGGQKKKMAHKKLTAADYQALAEFRYRLRLFLSFSEKAARMAGVTPQQHQALLAIKGYGGALTVGALAEKLVIRPHSAVELADRMAEAGWVRRGAGEDARQVTLRLTAAAETLLEELSRAHREELRGLLPNLASL
jgi:DNA-binding MarR family transcriptional regulator